jgi:hypothetical protein
MGPVSHKPAGTKTTPPPFLAIASIADAMLWVFRKKPSPLAPVLVIEIVSFLKTGDFTTGNCLNDCACIAVIANSMRTSAEHFFILATIFKTQRGLPLYNVTFNAAIYSYNRLVYLRNRFRSRHSLLAFVPRLKSLHFYRLPA